MTNFGPIALFGSGEIAPGAHRIHSRVMRRLDPPVSVAILETPAGFEPNSAAVAGKVGAYLEQHLRNFDPQVTVIPARKRGTDFDPDDPQLAAPIFQADYLFMGPGSPTYAVKQLRDSYAWHALQARHRLGAAIGFSSATTVAASCFALPVYEIYKVGEDLHWVQGLDFFGPFGLQLVIIPHWNNNDGGVELDTSRCYMGQDRFDRLRAMLPPETTVLGIDEHTGVIIDPESGVCELAGRGGVSILRDNQEERLERGARFSVHMLGDWRLPEPADGLPPDVWQRAQEVAASAGQEPKAQAPQTVLELATKREAARSEKDWETADAIRDQIQALGWQVLDTPEGPQLEPDS